MPRSRALTVPLRSALVGLAAAALPAGSLAQTSAEGESLAAELGCGACHAGVPAPERARARAPVLGPEGPPLPGDFVFTYLEAPERRRPDLGATRMPDFRLDEAERTALALFLGTPAAPSGPLASAQARHPGADADVGRRVFAALGCAGCHQGTDVEPGSVGPDLSREGVRVAPAWLRGFLAAPHSVRGDGHPLAPGARMPDFGLTEVEVAALTAYLRTLGSRFASLDAATLSPFQTRRTERFVERRLACLGCHRLDGRGGRIGPSLDDVATRLDPSFVLEMILDPARAAPGSPMPRQPMPAAEASRVARYLLARAAPRAGPVARRSLADGAHLAQAVVPELPAAALYQRHCAACHGASGRGDGWNAPDLPVAPAELADSARMAERADDTLFDGIHGGAWVLDGSPRMPPFGSLLSTDEIRQLVAYIRDLCGCEAPVWSRGDLPDHAPSREMLRDLRSVLGEPEGSRP